MFTKRLLQATNAPNSDDILTLSITVEEFRSLAIERVKQLNLDSPDEDRLRQSGIEKLATEACDVGGRELVRYGSEVWRRLAQRSACEVVDRHLTDRSHRRQRARSELPRAKLRDLVARSDEEFRAAWLKHSALGKRGALRIATEIDEYVLLGFQPYVNNRLPFWKRVVQIRRSGMTATTAAAVNRTLPKKEQRLEPRWMKTAQSILRQLREHRIKPPYDQAKRLTMRHVFETLQAEGYLRNVPGSDRNIADIYAQSRRFRMSIARSQHS